MHKPSKNAILIWRIRYTFAACIFMFISGCISVFNIYAGAFFAVIFLIIYLAAVLWYAKALYKSCSFCFRGNVILMYTGVFFKKEIILDYNKIQYFETLNSPLQRLFKTADLRIFTSGTSLKIKQLDLSLAKSIFESDDEIEK